MAHFSAIYGTSIKFPYRAFVIPWLKRNCISCGKGRDYSSSGPVKYVPKKNYKAEENEAGYLTETYSKNLGSSFVSNESRNCDSKSVSNRNVGLNLGLEEEEIGVVDSGEIGREIQTGSVVQDVEKSAIQLLASRAYTAMELKKKLQGKRYPLEIIDSVLTDFQSRGLINDCLYAETFSRSRWSSSSWGPHRIKQALFKKGVSGVDAEKAIKLVFDENDEADRDHNSGIAMSKLSIDQLYVQASKQWQRSNGAPLETRKSRIVRWLQYRGFNWSVIKCVLKKLESEGRT